MKIRAVSIVALAAVAGTTLGGSMPPQRAAAAAPAAPTPAAPTPAAPTPAAPAAAAPTGGAPTAARDLLSRDLLGAAGKELRVLTVDYIPGGASLAHRHNAQVFVYVLEGKVRMQVQGSPLLTLGPGDTFYEGPEDVHTVSANASATEPARILVFIVKDKGAPISTAVPQEQRP